MIKKAAIAVIAFGFIALGVIAFVWFSLETRFPDKSCMPLVYRPCPNAERQAFSDEEVASGRARWPKCGREKHDDWPWGLRWVPRKWGYFCAPMPPVQIAGSQPDSWSVEQDCYPMRDDAEWRPNEVLYIPEHGGMITRQFKSPQPIPDTGYWTLLAIPGDKLQLPSFFATSWRMFGFRFHFNVGTKPDTTTTYDRWRADDGPIYDADGKRLRPDNGCHVGDFHWGFPEISFTLRKINK